jgi:hypothetical protein
VTPAPLTITAQDASKVYGQTPVLSAFDASALVNGETVGSVTLVSTGQAATAGVLGSPYAIEASNATGGTFTASNYSITYVNGALTVTPAPLTITAQDASKVYGQTPVLSAFDASALVNGETVGSVTLASTGQAATAGVVGGPYAIVPSNATGGTFTPSNYTISYVDGVLTVTPAPLIITAQDVSKVYGQTAELRGFDVSALVNEETVGFVSMSSEGQSEMSSAEGGPYDIVPSNARGGSFTPTNYSVSYVSGVLTVTPIAPPIDSPAAKPVMPSTPDAQGTSEQLVLPLVPLRDVRPVPLIVEPLANQAPGPITLGATVTPPSVRAPAVAPALAPAPTPVPEPLPLSKTKVPAEAENPRPSAPIPIRRPLKQDRN